MLSKQRKKKASWLNDTGQNDNVVIYGKSHLSEEMSKM